VNRNFLRVGIARGGGRATTQAISCRLLIASARVRAQFRSCGICGGQSGTGAGFSQYFPFPLSILIPSTAPHSSIIRGWNIRPVNGRLTKWTQSHLTPRKNKLATGGRPGFDSWQGQGFCLLYSVHAASGVHPASYPMDMGGFFVGLKLPALETDQSPPVRAEIKNGGAIPPLPRTFSWRDA
jgi:hypothetical protein